MAMLGKEVRMSRLVNPKSNKMMAITVDHAISRGIAPMTGLHHIQDTIDKIILGNPDVEPCRRCINVNENFQLFSGCTDK